MKVLCKYLRHIYVWTREVKDSFICSKKLLRIIFTLVFFFNFALPVNAETFTASMAKRDAPGPFTAAPIVQGNYTNTDTTVGDTLTYTQGTQVSGNFYANADSNQGSVVMWFTPEWSSSTETTTHTLWEGGGVQIVYNGSNALVLYADDTNLMEVGNLNWTAGTTYNLVIRWDADNTLDNTNYASISINDSHTLGRTSAFTVAAVSANLSIGSRTNTYRAANGIIEGLTVYRRPLWDGAAGINIGNGDEINLIYNSGTGKDPTLITGSWDVVFALPTNSSTGALSTGTGNAWSHPHSTNLLYTNTTNTGGYMLNGTYTSDGFYAYGASSPTNTVGSSLNFDGNDGVVVSSLADNVASGNFAISLWFKLTNNHINGSTIKYLFGLADFSSTNDVDLLLDTNGTLSFKVYNGTSFDTVTTTQTSWTAGTWYHAVGIFDSSASQKLKIYVNGVQDGGVATASRGSTASGFALIGARMGDSRYFVGELDEVRVFTRSLTEEEIKSTMYKTSLTAAETTNLVGWYKFDEATGQTINDSSGNSNNGTLGGSTAVSSDDPTWDTDTASPTISALSSSEKIFPGGYKYTSNAANQGIYYDKTVTVGDDWVVRALANSDGTSIPKIEIWDQTNNVAIATQSGTITSTRTVPNTFIFTGEARTGQTNLRIILLNTASSGTTYWHQVEVLSNNLTNPSMESWQGTSPDIPTSWTNGDLDSGTPNDIEQESTTVHSGSKSVKGNSGWTTSENIYYVPTGGTTDDFVAFGAWFYGSGSQQNIVKSNDAKYQHTLSSQLELVSPGTASWHHVVSIGRLSTNRKIYQVYNNSNNGVYWDDLYQINLTAISLTVTPASEANSTENTDEIRVDGRDTYTASSAEATSITSTSGYVSFNYRPRHAASDSVKFSETTSDDSYIVSLSGDSNDYIRVYWDSANTIAMSYSMNGTTESGTWDATGSIASNTEYAVSLSYTGSSTMVLSIGGTNRITLSSIPASFGTSPNNPVYFGSDTSSSNQGDATFSNIVFDNTSPVISNISSSSSTTGATITWTTDENSSSQVDYGLSNSYGSQTAETDTSPRVTSHSVSLSSLVSCTTYHYRVRSTDAASNATVSVDSTFTTTGCSGGSAVLAETSQSVTTSGGSVLVTNTTGGSTTVTLPVNYYSETTTIQVKQLNTSPVISALGTPTLEGQSFLVIGNKTYNIESLTGVSNQVTSFSQPITITMTYLDNEVTNINENTIKIFRYDTTLSSWVSLDNCVTNSNTNTTTCTTTKFSTFGLFGNSSSSGTSSSQSNYGVSSQCTDPSPGARPPQIYAANSNTNSVTLFYSPGDTPYDHYGVRFGTSPNNFYYGSLNIAQKNDTSAVINYLLPNTTYYFQLQGRNGCTGGVWSGTFSIKTKGLSISSILPQTSLEIIETEISPEITATPNTEIVENIKGIVSPIPSTTPIPTPTLVSTPIESVTITVKDPQNQPVGGANVILHSDPKEGVTDSEGKVTFTDVERGEHTLIVQSSNFTGEQKLNLIGDKESYDISITILPKTSYTGTVIGFIAGGVIIFILMMFINRRRNV